MNFLKKDLKEEAKIRRRRQHEEERKKRIFDPRTRLFGVDVEAWQQQLLEKQMKEEQEKCNEEAYIQSKNQEGRLCEELQEMMKKERREQEKRLVEYWQVHQKIARNRELYPNDSHLSCADNGVMRFDGEDITCKERTHLQKEQMRAWLVQQMAEKKRIQEQQKAMEESIIKTSLAMDTRAKELDLLEQECQRTLRQTTADYNRLAAEEKAAAFQMEAARQAKVEAEEVQNWMTGDFLNENPVNAASALGPGRVIPYMFKGEPPAKTLLTKQEQLQQARLKKIQAEQDVAHRKEWEIYEKRIYEEASNKVEQLMREQRDLNHHMLEVNARLAEEQRRRLAEMNSLRDLHPTPAFFEQFNRSTY